MTAGPGPDRRLPHPLVFVAAEVRVPVAPRLSQAETAERLAATLPVLPLLRQEQRSRVEQTPGGLNIQAEQGWRLTDRSSSTSLVVSPSSVVLETTRYPGFESFLDLLLGCCRAVADVAAPVGVERLGMRYVNEVRPPQPPAAFSEWGSWVSPTLVAAANDAEANVHAAPVAGAHDSQLQNFETTLTFSLPDTQALTCRMAALNGAGVVGNAPLLRWENPAPGPFFVVDLDAFWPREPMREVEEFDIDRLRVRAEHLHHHVKAAFAWAVTDAYRKEVLTSDEHDAGGE